MLKFSQWEISHKFVCYHFVKTAAVELFGESGKLGKFFDRLRIPEQINVTPQKSVSRRALFGEIFSYFKKKCEHLFEIFSVFQMI